MPLGDEGLLLAHRVHSGTLQSIIAEDRAFALVVFAKHVVVHPCAPCMCVRGEFARVRMCVCAGDRRASVTGRHEH